MIHRAFRVCLAAAACLSVLHAATSTTWQVSGFSDFSKGILTGLTLSADGTLAPGPAVSEAIPLNQPAAWSIAAAPQNGVFIATGNNGKVFRVDASGAVSEVWSAPQPEVFAIAATPDGAIYAGSSPDGAIYRLEHGSAKFVWKSEAKYIWAIRLASDGSLYVATGDKGRIYRVTPNGDAAVYYETGQGNVTALAIGTYGHLLAGTDPNGLVYDISGPGKGTVVYDSPLPEIRSIAVAEDGTMYVAAMGGAVATRSAQSTSATGPAPATVVTATTPTVVTVTEAADQNAASQAPIGATSTSSASTAAPGQPAAVVEVSGADKSAIYKINSARAVETLRTSKEDNVYDIALSSDDLLAATDVHGRLFRLSGHRTALLSEIGDGAITRLLVRGETIYAILSNPARLIILNGAGHGPASFESQVHDAVSVGRWGHLQWHGSGSGIAFETRTGFSARPDSTWSAWTPVDPASFLIASPPARFVQLRARWNPGSAASVDTIDVPYLPQNNAPTVHSITVASIVNQNATKSNVSSSAAANAPYSITVTDTGEAPAASTGSGTNQPVTHLQITQTQISWQADDPDGDRLSYSIYFKAEEEKDWQLVRSHVFENSLLLDPDVFADGRYFFRVVASDAPSNAPEYAQQSELISTPVLIDNTPPDVHIGDVRRDGSALDVDVTAEDKTSPLRICEYSLDAGGWQPIESTDGVTDSPKESFHLHLDKLRPGEHLLVFRVYDIVNNAGLAKTIVR